MILHLLALDTAAAVVGWSLAGGRLLGATADPFPLFWTGAGVWLVYAADRWLDSFPGGRESAPGERHRFAARHRNALAAAWIVVWIAALGTGVALLPARELLAALLLVAGGGAYLGFVQARPAATFDRDRRAGRAFAVAALVASAALFFPLARGPAPLGDKALVWFLVFLLFLLQTLATRAWEAAERPSAGPFAGLAVAAGGLALFLDPPVAALAAVLALVVGVAVVDRLPLSDKVSAADWTLAAAALAAFLPVG